VISILLADSPDWVFRFLPAERSFGDVQREVSNIGCCFDIARTLAQRKATILRLLEPQQGVFLSTTAKHNDAFAC